QQQQQQQQQQQVCQSGKEQNPHYLKSPADQSNKSDAGRLCKLATRLGSATAENLGEESDELFSAAVVSTALDSPEVAGVSKKDNANSLLKEKQKKKRKKAKRESAKSVNLTEYLTVSSLSPGLRGAVRPDS
uniref:NCOA7 n=1 Tax=Macrostomum lignano TaxID=282301 RepID=A0A1I8FBV0_9PLAT